MATNLDPHSSINRFVSIEVQRALRPYLDILERMTRLLDSPLPAPKLPHRAVEARPEPECVPAPPELNSPAPAQIISEPNLGPVVSQEPSAESSVESVQDPKEPPAENQKEETVSEPLLVPPALGGVVSIRRAGVQIELGGGANSSAPSSW